MFDEISKTVYDKFELIGFACLAIISLFILSHFSGWWEISGRYPSRPFKIKEKWYMRSMWMGSLFTRKPATVERSNTLRWTVATA